MSRDWKKDMGLCESVKESEWDVMLDGTPVWKRGSLLSTIWEGIDQEAFKEHKEALPYWLQQYAAEKARADQAEKHGVELCRQLFEAEGHITELRKQVIGAEAREEQLKYAFKVMLGYVPETARKALDFEEVLSSLYPKEEEAK